MAKAKAKEENEIEEEKNAEAGVEGEEGAEGAEGEVGGKSKLKLSKKQKIIAVIVALLLVGGGIGGFVAFSKKGAEHTQEDVIELDEHGNPISKTVYYTMPQFLVNLNSTGKSQVFLKTTVVLEVAKATDIPYIESNLPRLVDGINTYLRELRSSDLAGSAGIQRLREEILLRVNKAIAPMQVNDVLFKEIIVQ